MYRHSLYGICRWRMILQLCAENQSRMFCKLNMDKQQTDPLYRTDIQTVDIRNLTDISDIRIDTALKKSDRMQNFIRDIKNPYCFRCKNTVVKVSFCSGGSPFEELLQDYFRSLSDCE